MRFGEDSFQDFDLCSSLRSPLRRTRYLLVAEKGNDCVLVYAFDQRRGTLSLHSATDVGVNGGARHLCFGPSGDRVYVNEEAGAKVTVMGWDGRQGTLTALQVRELRFPSRPPDCPPPARLTALPPSCRPRSRSTRPSVRNSARACRLR